tara:strand:+ start:2100 stop:2924 length:825 start_codon:yes stop_codon:yes gene_type:complete
MVDISNITFEELLDIRQKLIQNLKKIREEESLIDENASLYNLPNYEGYHFQRIEHSFNDGSINSTNYQRSYIVDNLVDLWNKQAYGKDYPKLLKKYNKIASDPKNIMILKEIHEKSPRTWGYVWRDSKNAVANNRFLTFWQWTLAWNDTKGSWRHWWDTLTNDKRFNIGDMIELRASTRRSHVYYEYTHSFDTKYRYLRTLPRSDMAKIKNKVFMVIAYDQKTPLKTYSYKKSQGSHRVLTVLPIGSTKVYYIPEQFVKISRKQAVKDAKGKKK